MVCKLSFRGHIKRTVCFGLIVLVFILFWQRKSLDNVGQIRGKAEKCPTIQKHHASTRNVFGFDPEVKKALSCRFEERRKRLNQSCQSAGPHIYLPSVSRNVNDGRNTFVEYNFTICLLEKIGSKFWGNYLGVFNGVETRSLKAENYHNNIKIRSLKPDDYQNIVKIVFVRDPYSRLFSGYVDKFFTTNPSYWKIVGPDVLRSVRPNTTGILQETECGIDITFAEFVEYILKHYKVYNMDRHFMPIQHRCDFCNTQYDFIGKMETFLDDVIFISDVIGLLKYNTTRMFLLEEGMSAVHEMKRVVQYIYAWCLPLLEYCGVSLHQAFKLIWRQWQIQGFIETKFDFPFKKGDSIKETRLVTLALDAHSLSDKRNLSGAKMAALRQAYSSLSLKTKLKLKEIFLPQFDMFDYEAMPEKVFGKYSKLDYNFDFFEKQTIFKDI